MSLIELPSYESHYFTNGQQFRHTIHTDICTSIWIGTFYNTGILYKGEIFSLNEFAKAHRRNIIGWKECEIDGWKECEYKVDTYWVYLSMESIKKIGV